MARIRKIALFADGYYAQLLQLFGLKRGFEQIGVECFATWPLPKPEQLNAFVNVWKPDVIFEWDRSRHQAMAVPRHILHVAWLQNHRNFGLSTADGMGGSDLYYTNLPIQRVHLNVDKEECKVLFPGADEEIFNRDIPGDYLYDLNLCGFFHSPVSEKTFNTPVVVNGIVMGTIRSFFEDVVEAGLYEVRNFDTGAIHDLLLFKMRRYVPQLQMHEIPDAFKELFDVRLARLYTRLPIAEGMIAASDRVAFCGSESWQAWPQFAPYYRGNLTNPHDLAKLYRQTRIGVHDSIIGMHHRTMEVMACARPLMVNYNMGDDSPLDIANFFTPGEDFIRYDPKTLAETAREALADPQRLERIGLNAWRKVQAAHLWRHRAEQILRDLDAT